MHHDIVHPESMNTYIISNAHCMCILYMIGKQSKPAKDTSTTQDKTADEAVYDEPRILSPKTSLQMEICPAYEVTKT